MCGGGLAGLMSDLFKYKTNCKKKLHESLWTCTAMKEMLEEILKLLYNVLFPSGISLMSTIICLQHTFLHLYIKDAVILIHVFHINFIKTCGIQYQWADADFTALIYIFAVSFVDCRHQEVFTGVRSRQLKLPLMRHLELASHLIK